MLIKSTSLKCLLLLLHCIKWDPMRQPQVDTWGKCSFFEPPAELEQHLGTSQLHVPVVFNFIIPSIKRWWTGHRWSSSLSDWTLTITDDCVCVCVWTAGLTVHWDDSSMCLIFDCFSFPITWCLKLHSVFASLSLMIVTPWGSELMLSYSNLLSEPLVRTCWFL